MAPPAPQAQCRKRKALRGAGADQLMVSIKADGVHATLVAHAGSTLVFRRGGGFEATLVGAAFLGPGGAPLAFTVLEGELFEAESVIYVYDVWLSLDQRLGVAPGAWMTTDFRARHRLAVTLVDRHCVQGGPLRVAAKLFHDAADARVLDALPRPAPPAGLFSRDGFFAHPDKNDGFIVAFARANFRGFHVDDPGRFLRTLKVKPVHSVDLRVVRSGDSDEVAPAPHSTGECVDRA